MERAQPDQPITWWLKHVDGLLEVAFDRCLEREGIARPHWQALNAVVGGAVTTGQVEAAFTRLGGASAEARAAVAQLVTKGWLRAEGGRLGVTPTGTAARERLLVSVRGQRDRLTSGIDAEQYRTTVDTLRRMARNLSV